MIDLFGEQPEEVRALSWKQPYAELMFHGKIETRTWNTNYRGLVLICTSKVPYHRDQVINISGMDQLKRIETMLGNPVTFKGNTYPLGMAIGIGELVHCRMMTPEDEDLCFVGFRDVLYEAYAYQQSKPLYCHIYKNVRRIKPFPWLGSQGWKTLDNKTKELAGLI